MNGQTLLPGFIDFYCPFCRLPWPIGWCTNSPPPDAGAKNIESLINILARIKATPENVELTGWIFGLGFDDSVMEEKRFPTKIRS